VAVGDVLLESAHKIGYVLGAEPTSPYSTMTRLEMRIKEVNTASLIRCRSTPRLSGFF
jgi:hypothetical protein